MSVGRTFNTVFFLMSMTARTPLIEQAHQDVVVVHAASARRRFHHGDDFGTALQPLGQIWMRSSDTRNVRQRGGVRHRNTSAPYEDRRTCGSSGLDSIGRSARRSTRERLDNECPAGTIFPRAAVDR